MLRPGLKLSYCLRLADRTMRSFAGPQAEARRGRALARPRYRHRNIWWETRDGFGGLPHFVIRWPAIAFETRRSLSS
jgi:hypothetical protein